MEVEYTNKLSRNEHEHIIHKVILHDRVSVGAGAPKSIHFGARIDGALIGGICGHMELRRLYIDYLWVEHCYRGNGIGSSLLKTAESDATTKGCIESRIESLSIKTAKLYVWRGYKIIHRLPDYIPGLPLIVLSKLI
jgi:GNAT superfamily N-acetyltransferase